MEFNIEIEGKERLCRVVDVSELTSGKEDGLIQLRKDGSKGNTLVSHCAKTDVSRYGLPLWEMISNGWRPFRFSNGSYAA